MKDQRGNFAVWPWYGGTLDGSEGEDGGMLGGVLDVSGFESVTIVISAAQVSTDSGAWPLTVLHTDADQGYHGNLAVWEAVPADMLRGEATLLSTDEVPTAKDRRDR